MCLSYKMTPPAIDRLSALLGGLSPRVSLSPAPRGLALHILVKPALNDAALDLGDMVLWVRPCWGPVIQVLQRQRRAIAFG